MQREDEELKKVKGDIDIEDVLDEISKTLYEYFILPEGANDLIVLWVLASYTVHHGYYTKFPLLHVFSPTKSCGKSTLQELIGFFCKKSYMTASPSPAALFHLIEKHKPTLLLDEVDHYIHRKNNEFVNILNAGYQKANPKVLRVNNDINGTVQYDVWGAKVTAGIGQLPDTLLSRGLLVKLEKGFTKARKLKRITTNLDNKFKLVRRKLDTWATQNKKTLEEFIEGESETPTYLGRNMDNWMPLLNVAGCLSDEWYKRYLKAKEIYEDNNKTIDDDTQLFRDIRSVFLANEKKLYKQSKHTKASAKQWNRLTAATLTELLHAVPDSRYKGDRLTSYKLRQKLSTFSISFKKQRIKKDGSTGNCYIYSDIENVIESYC